MVASSRSVSSSPPANAPRIRSSMPSAASRTRPAGAVARTASRTAAKDVARGGGGGSPPRPRDATYSTKDARHASSPSDTCASGEGAYRRRDAPDETSTSPARDARPPTVERLPARGLREVLLAFFAPPILNRDGGREEARERAREGCLSGEPMIDGAVELLACLDRCRDDLRSPTRGCSRHLLSDMRITSLLSDKSSGAATSSTSSTTRRRLSRERHVD